MSKPTLCIIHEAISQDSAIAKIAMLDVRAALDAGWEISVVAKILDPSLRDRVNWLKLTVPPRGFILKWLTARHFIRSALGHRSFDVIHAHQPQVADLADVYQCHFLTRAAYERNCLESRPGLRAKFARLQQQGVLHAEDRFYRRWNPETHMLFCSDLLRQEFAHLYGMPPRQQVLVNPCPPVNFANDAERRAARQRWVGDHNGIVLGYLGGVEERKGFKKVLQALKGHGDIFFLMGGAHSEGFVDPNLSGHMKSVGMVLDPASFYAACDVFVVPSLFDPFALVVCEAAARGTPVIATESVGALANLLEHQAGLAWRQGDSLADLVRQAAGQREKFNAGARRLSEALSEQEHGRQLMAVYDMILRAKRTAAAPAAKASACAL